MGSVICGSKKFIYQARHIRKALGGGMRQAGIIAAAGIFSLDKMIKQIREDHNNAKMLMEGISKIDGLSINKGNIKSNILYFYIEKGKTRSKNLAKQTTNKNQYPININLDNICFFETSPNHFRLVTHYGITHEDVEKSLIVLGDMVY